MITKYLTTLHTQFAPLSMSKAHRTSRILLSFLPSNATSAPPNGLGMKISRTILASNSREPARITVGLKGGESIVFEDHGAAQRTVAAAAAAAAAASSPSSQTGVLDLSKMSIKDVVEEIDRRSRKLSRIEELS